MPRSHAQSDFVVYAAAPPADPSRGHADGPDAADDGAGDALPQATLRSTEASARATRWVMGFTWFMLILLVLLCLIGPHIPSGE